MLTQHHRYACYKKPAHNRAEEKLCVFVIELKAPTVINVFKLGSGCLSTTALQVTNTQSAYADTRII